jgi:hypothetical protein
MLIFWASVRLQRFIFNIFCKAIMEKMKTQIAKCTMNIMQHFGLLDAETDCVYFFWLLLCCAVAKHGKQQC